MRLLLKNQDLKKAQHNLYFTSWLSKSLLSSTGSILTRLEVVGSQDDFGFLRCEMSSDSAFLQFAQT